MSRLLSIATLILFAFAIFTLNASAGGWATVVFDPLPEEIHAGDTVTVRFIVRQHGNNPVHQAFNEPLVATVHVRTSPQGKPMSVEATPDKEIGYYTADLTFPQQGLYELSVTTNMLVTEEAAPNLISVPVSAMRESVAEPLVAGTSSNAPAFSPVLVFAGIGIVLLLVGGTVAIVRTR